MSEHFRYQRDGEVQATGERSERVRCQRALPEPGGSEVQV